MDIASRPRGGYVVKQDMKIHGFLVPAGFVCDGLSGPGDSDRPGFRAAILHDYLYAKAVHPRDFCDKVFRKATRHELVHEHQWAGPAASVVAWARWVAVRLFGGPHYG